jgi:hypothetical protein
VAQLLPFQPMAMDPFLMRQNRMLYILALLLGLFLFISRAEGAPRLPDVREAPE